MSPGTLALSGTNGAPAALIQVRLPPAPPPAAVPSGGVPGRGKGGEASNCVPYNHLFSLCELGVNVERGYCTLLVDLCSALSGPWMGDLGFSWFFGFMLVFEYVLGNAFMTLCFLFLVALTVTYLWFVPLPISVSCLIHAVLCLITYFVRHFYGSNGLQTWVINFTALDRVKFMA